MCFFFKQKTAYEMRISDWSSDVCSSDLTMAVLKGKRRSTRQQITVTHEKHIHHHQHVHLEGGADETGVQPHARQGKSPDAVLDRAALPSTDPIGDRKSTRLNSSH